MPRKGMRSIFFKPSSSSPSTSSSSQPPPSPLHTFSDSMMEQNIHTAESLITEWDDSKLATPLFSGTRQEAKNYLHAVKGLQSAMHYFVKQDSSSATLVRAQFLMQLAMKTLQREFYQILSSNRDYLDSETVSARSSIDFRSSVSDYVSDYDDEITASEDDFRISETERVSMLAMEDLKAIADCMTSSGYGKECVKVYIIMRKSIVDEALYHLGVEKLTLARVQKLDWEVLELKIKKWLNAVKVAVGTLFPGERILCDHVFSSNPAKRIAESCFAEITKDGAVSLFAFPEFVAKWKKTPEKMFRTLDLYEAISDRLSQIESIFSSESTSVIRSQAITSLVRLGEAVRAMLVDFESAIQKDSSKTTIPGGGVHPLTRYVMNYLTFLADYSGVLIDIIPDLPQSPMPESYYRSPMRGENTPASELSEKIAWLILVVLCKLDGKAEFYKNVALSYLFLANNMQYVVEKVRRSNLGFLLGEEWLAKHELKVSEYASNYERVGWSKVFASLPENPASQVTAEQAKTCFVKFDAAFHETCRKQSSWVVSDPKLRDEIKGSIVSKLSQKYSEFHEKNRVGLKFIRVISPEDIGKNLSNILCGNGSVDSGSFSSHSSSTTSSSHRSNRR